MQSAAKHLAWGSRINYCCTRDASSLLDAQNALHDVLISLQDVLNSFTGKGRDAGARLQFHAVVICTKSLSQQAVMQRAAKHDACANNPID